MPTQSRTTIRVGPLLIGMRIGAALAGPVLACGPLILTRSAPLMLLGMVLAVVGPYQLLGLTLRIHADQDGITVVRPWRRRYYPWSRVVGLALITVRDSEAADEQAVRIYARHPKHPDRLVLSPVLIKPIGPDDLPTPPRLAIAAEVFALFTDRDLPVEQPDYVNQVLLAAGRPPRARRPPARNWPA